MKRRDLLSYLGATTALTLSGCSVVKEGKHIYHLYLDVKTATKYIDGILKIAKAILPILKSVGMFGMVATATIAVAIYTLGSEATAFNHVTNGSLEVDYNDTNIKTAYDSLIAAAKVVVDSIKLATEYWINSLSSSQKTEVIPYISAATTLLNSSEGLVKRLAPYPSETGMTPIQALKISEYARQSIN